MTHLTAEPNPVPQKRLLGEDGLWVYIMGDLIVFGIVFVSYVVYRADDVRTFNESQAHLDAGLGLASTVILLASSLFAAWAVKKGRLGQGGVVPLLLAAAACGVGFCATRMVEFFELIDKGFGLTTTMFFSFYYMLVCLHVMSIVNSLAALGYMIHRTRIAQHEANYVSVLEGGSAVWHGVVPPWLMMFALFYFLK